MEMTLDRGTHAVSVSAVDRFAHGLPTRMVIVFNPVAGRRRAHLLWRVLDVLVANGVRLDLAETHRAGHAEALAREAAWRGEQMVVAAGGDGTIAEIANGLMGSSARLGVIPLGTANVLAHELGLPFAPKSVAAALAFGRTCTLWPGQANGPDGTRLFVQMLGVGFDAHVVRNLPFPLKKLFGKGAYVMQSMRELARYKFPVIRMRIDDIETEAASVIISKGRLYGGGFASLRRGPGQSGLLGGPVRPLRPRCGDDVRRRPAAEPARTCAWGSARSGEADRFYAE